MAVEIEIDYPIPGDVIGTSFTVAGTYTLTGTGTAPGTITVTILKSNGTAYPTGGAGSDTMVANPQVQNGVGNGTNVPWSFAFQYNLLQSVNCKIDARLTPNTGTPDTDLVEGVSISLNAMTE